MANVLSLVPYKIFPPKFGGQKGIALFNEYFSKYHRLYCVTIKENFPSDVPYVVINKMGNSRLRYVNPVYFFLLKKIIRQNRISHVIIEHPYFGWLGLLLKKFCKIKLIIHSHNIESERFKTTGKWWWKILWHYEKFIHKNADFTFCISEKDRQYFINRFRVPALRTSVITYGISWEEIPSLADRLAARKTLLEKHNLRIETTLFLFNGALEYPPNLDAVKNIIWKINPLLMKEKLDYKIIICGKNLPAEMKGLKEYVDKNIIYAGFVDDISVYFKGADVFINPITDGGGIKTKLVEALGSNLNAVSTMNGAIGVDENICNNKLLLSGNTDWQDFSQKMKEATLIKNSMNSDFFQYFYWDNITKKASGIIDGL